MWDSDSDDGFGQGQQNNGFGTFADLSRSEAAKGVEALKAIDDKLYAIPPPRDLVAEAQAAADAAAEAAAAAKILEEEDPNDPGHFMFYILCLVVLCVLRSVPCALCFVLRAANCVLGVRCCMCSTLCVALRASLLHVQCARYCAPCCALCCALLSELLQPELCALYYLLFALVCRK
jgi:hypothetical protein